uniref:DNA/RNA-binding protein Kin17 WH-like domain-containing protein n=1 Tax=Gouania willdenowi TaxID=441366 RepID=A0A8C5ENI8_GOUWI
MGKSDFLSPKAISNRIKAKGLQKLRWYCQMCQKQCRDENGFKCHCMSESHQRQLLLASENPNRFLDYFSDEFKRDFLELLSRRFGTKRVHNNIVYNEYISHREHVHMNSTKWETLTEFTKWLGRQGLCKVDETPKGWYIEYIDRDPETIRRQDEQAKKKKQDLDDQERSAKFIRDQVRRGRDGKETEVSTERIDVTPVWFLKVTRVSTAVRASTSSSSSSSVKRKDMSSSSDSKMEKKKKKSALEEIIEMETRKQQQQQPVRTDHWLQPNIVVKVVTKRLGDKYHKKKAVVMEVRDKYEAVVKMIDSGDKLKLDQTHVETVVPTPGKRVLILNGPHRETEALLEGINEKSFNATLTLESGQQKGKRQTSGSTSGEGIYCVRFNSP